MNLQELEQLEEALNQFDFDYCSPGRKFRQSQHHVVQLIEMVKRVKFEEIRENG